HYPAIAVLRIHRPLRAELVNHHEPVASECEESQDGRWDLGPRTSDLGPQGTDHKTTDHGPGTTDFRLRPSHLDPPGTLRLALCFSCHRSEIGDMGRPTYQLTVKNIKSAERTFRAVPARRIFDCSAHANFRISNL